MLTGAYKFTNYKYFYELVDSAKYGYVYNNIRESKNTDPIPGLRMLRRNSLLG